MTDVDHDHHTIQDLLVSLFVAVDEKDWFTARACFADVVAFDVTSLAGGEPAEVPADDIVAGWTDGLAPVKHVHHQVANFRISVENGAANVHCYGTAYHYRDDGDAGPTITTFVGTYDFGLLRSNGSWVVDALRFNSKFVDTRPASTGG